MLLTLGNSGCSYAFVHKPTALGEVSSSEPQQLEQTGAACTSSNALPIFDTILAVPLLGAGVTAITGGATCGHDCEGFGSGIIAVGAALTALGTLALSSAITGYGRTADCRRTQEALPKGPHAGRHLLDVNGIAEARARENKEEP
jgi:hypothetical protein